MIPQHTPVMTPEQRRRQDLQVEWLASAIREAPISRAEPSQCVIDARSLRIGGKCPTCGAVWWGDR